VTNITQNDNDCYNSHFWPHCTKRNNLRAYAIHVCAMQSNKYLTVQCWHVNLLFVTRSSAVAVIADPACKSTIG